MFSTKKIISSMVVVLTTQIPQQAMAMASGSIVHDPIHTMQSFLSTVQLIQAEVTRAKQLKSQMDQLKQLGNIDTWKAQANRELDGLKGYIKSLEATQGSLNSNSSRLQQRLSEAALSHMSLEEYAKLEANRVQAGNSDAIRRQDGDMRDMKKLEEDYTSVQSWERDINQDSTQIDSARMMNQQLNKIVTMNAQATKAMLATRIENRDDKLRDEAADKNFATLQRDALEKKFNGIKSSQDESKRQIQVYLKK
jgi:cell shape-determining protein MreC